MTTVTSVLSELEAYAREHADGSTRIVGTLEKGQYVAQGDINIFGLGSEAPEGITPVKGVHSGQLAPGTTRGSRHCIATGDMPHVQIFDVAKQHQNELVGNVLFLEKETTIEHPEHGNQVFAGGQYLGITYQRLRADEIRRMQD